MVLHAHIYQPQKEILRWHKNLDLNFVFSKLENECLLHFTPEVLPVVAHLEVYIFFFKTILEI